MKRLLFIICAYLVLSSCSGTKEASSARSEIRNEKKLAQQVIVKQAVEARRYIIKLDRLYLSPGMVDLIPRANYIIIDGKKAIICATYFGRQYDIKPIAGINVHGIATDYSVTSNQAKGKYEVKMKVEKNAASFDVYLTIGRDGTCDAYVNSLKINGVRYRGYIVPINDGVNVPLQNNEVIGD